MKNINVNLTIYKNDTHFEFHKTITKKVNVNGTAMSYTKRKVKIRNEDRYLLQKEKTEYTVGDYTLIDTFHIGDNYYMSKSSDGLIAFIPDQSTGTSIVAKAESGDYTGFIADVISTLI